MNKTLGLLLVVYSLLLAGLSYLVYHLAPGETRPALVAGLGGGALCLVWGVRALAGRGGKALPLLTLIPVSFTLLPQVFGNWSGESGASEGGWTVAAILTVLLVISLGMLVRIAWSGMVFDVPAGGSAKDGEAKGERSGKRAS